MLSPFDLEAQGKTVLALHLNSFYTSGEEKSNNNRIIDNISEPFRGAY